MIINAGGVCLVDILAIIPPARQDSSFIPWEGATSPVVSQTTKRERDHVLDSDVPRIRIWEYVCLDLGLGRKKISRHRKKASVPKGIERNEVLGLFATANVLFKSETIFIL
jgi:hypothetical protein